MNAPGAGVRIIDMGPEHWEAVASIYEAGLATGMASFEAEVPSYPSWDESHMASCRLVAVAGDRVCGWAALSPVSSRCVYAGVAEVSVYVDPGWQGKGVGGALLRELVERSEADGIWTLQAGILTENRASIALHEKCGFRVVGVRERLGQRDGQWRDVMLLERRSSVVGV
jgi:phosphinothricin acetyltransferase